MATTTIGAMTGKTALATDELEVQATGGGASNKVTALSLLGIASPTLNSPSLTGVETHGGTDLFTAAATGGLAVDITKARTTTRLSADATVTFSGSPTDGQEFGLELTCHTSAV